MSGRVLGARNNVIEFVEVSALDFIGRMPKNTAFQQGRSSVLNVDE